MLKYRGLGFEPELFIGEISGGVPAAANWKTWYDYVIKLVLGARLFMSNLWNDKFVGRS